MQNIELLKQAPIFSALGPGELSEFARLAQSVSFKAGEYIFWEGEESKNFYLVAEGRIKVLKHASTGKEFIVAFFGPGEMFGEAAVFQGKPYPASAQATNDVRALLIARESFLSFLAAHPVVSLGIINMLAERLRDAQARLKDLAGERVEQRIARILLMLSTRLGPNLPFTRQEIAEMAGTTTETAIRVMGHFRERGLLRSVRGHTTLLDETKLRLLAEGPPVLDR